MRVGIAATVKNEASYLLEWIAFHRAVGIECFFIADNGGGDGTTELLIRLETAGYIVRFDFVGVNAPQCVAYDAMIPRMRDAVELVAIIDADEFIRPVEGDRADLALACCFSQQDVSGVAINWSCYGSSNHLFRGDGLVLERFSMRSEQSFAVNKHVKSVIRVDKYRSYVNPHFFRVSSGRYIDTSGEDIQWDTNAVPVVPGIAARCLWDKMRIDHFVVKSLEEFETIKRPRGRGDVPREHLQYLRSRKFFDEHDRNDVNDPMPGNILNMTKSELRAIKLKLKDII